MMLIECEIRCQVVQETYNSRFQTLLVLLILNNTTKVKLHRVCEKKTGLPD